MALQGTFPVVRRPTGAKAAAAGNATDRARSFAHARRHTALVRFMRYALPATALIALMSYGAGMRMKYRTPMGKIDTGTIAISTQNLTMSNPRYEGFNKDGSRFTVAAKTAVQDIKQQGPIELTQIDGRIVQVTNGIVTLTAPRGTFDNKTNQLELFDDIKIRGDDGMRADLSQATILMKENRIVSRQPVAIDMAAGQVRANEMDIRQATKQVIFGNGVMTRLKPALKPAGAAPKAVSNGGPRMMGSSDVPVDIASRTLHVDDVKKTAIFTGDVVARQGEATLSAPEVQAFYDGAAMTAAGAAPTTAGKLSRLFVPSNVMLIQGTDRITADSADFDATQETMALLGRVVMNSGPERKATSDRADLDSRSDTALLTGNVVVTQDKNVLRGGRLFLDRKAGVTKLSTPSEGGSPAGRIATRFYQAAAGAAKGPVKKTEPQTAATPGAGLVFRTDPNAPIDIDAETLDVRDKDKTATYRGAVHAVQGGFQIRTPELVATYSGEAGMVVAGAGEAKQQSAQLQRVRANQHVEVTSTGNQSATGDWADFDVKANKVIIGGKVALKDGESVVYGQKAIIDMTTGVTYMENENKGNGPSVSFSPTEQRAPYTLPDLPTKKEPVAPPAVPAFATDPNACGAGRQCAVFSPKSGLAAKSGGKADSGKNAAQPWQTETAPVPKRKAPTAETSGWTSTPPSRN
ncbi:MAG: LPS export ABC transporter periplasmic protein LptC [Hyphomicrobiaceae bacterium]